MLSMFPCFDSEREGHRHNMALPTAVQSRPLFTHSTTPHFMCLCRERLGITAATGLDH